jgi:serine/threonine protein kinase
MTLPASVCGYEILAELGRGPTGIVYKARHSMVEPNRLVALKMPSLGSGPEAGRLLARHENEWNALRVLTWEPDPVIPTLYNAGCDAAWQNHHYVREFVDGDTLERSVASGAVNFHEGIRVLAAIAGAVRRMHGRWIAHRNLRAPNILVRTDGAPKLIGFGHVWPLAGDDRLPPGMSGVSAEVDVRGLQGILNWLCAALPQPVPASLEAIRRPGSVASAAQFEEALSRHLHAE